MIDNISRQPIQQSLTASGNINVDSNVVICDATSGAITATLYTSPGDSALHQVVVQKSDSSANAVTVTDSTYTFTLTAQYDTVTVRLNESGAWFGVSGYDSSGTGDVEGPSSATDGAPALFNGTTGKIIKNSVPTGSGVPVLATSPTLITPALGTPASGVLTNCTGTASGLTAGDASSVIKKEVTADVTNATATMANLTDLSVTLAAAGIYVGEMIVKCSDSTAAEGIAFDFDGSAATMTAFAAGAGVLTGGTSVASVTTSTAIATDLVWTTITNETWITIRLAMTVNGAGTFIPRFCQGTAHTSGTATVSRGSYLVLNKV
jgi:hypothetical protein